MWDKDQLWQTVSGELEVGFSGATFSSWIKPCFIISLAEMDSERILVELACSTPYHVQTIDEKYYTQIKRAIESQTGRKCELALVVKQKESEGKKKEEVGTLFAQEEKIDDRDLLIGCGLNPKFTFDNFVVGSSNNLAYSAAKAVVEMPGGRHNPLFIYGGVGVGKTHLMHAVGRAMMERGYPKVKAVTSEQFTNEFVATLRSKMADSFKQRYRGVDTLLIDDIQFIAGKEQTQEEFFHTFNHLYAQSKQIILTSDKKPQEITGLEERLSSRMMGGLMVDIGLPNFEMRLAILKQKCSEINIEPEEGALDLIATNVNTNSRELEGLLMRLVSLASMEGSRLNQRIVEKELGVRGTRLDKRLRPQEVISLIAKQFEFKNKDLVGASRKAELVRARHVAMYILRVEMGLTLQQVASLMGRSDHTTVLHAVDKVEKEFMINLETREQVMRVKQQLYH